MVRFLFWAGWVLLVFDVADFSVSGLMVLTVVCWLVAAWLSGLFTRGAWIADDATSERLSAVDVELDAEGL